MTPTATASMSATPSIEASATNTATPTMPVTSTPTAPMPTATATAVCSGDCNSNGVVSMDELLLGVELALGSPSAGTCPALNLDGDPQVSIEELVRAVRAENGGC